MLSFRQFFGTPAGGALFDVMLDKLRMRQALESRPNSVPVMERAAERCANCGREDSCVAWMAGNVNPHEAPYFCRNHDLFERLKHDIAAEKHLQPVD